MIKLEICAYNIDSCIAALNGGADRVELCASMLEGGITPSYATIKKAVGLGIDIMCMIRPKGGDFLYSNDDFELMQEDIITCKALGVKGVVFGILKTDGSVDINRNKMLINLCGNMQTCFHRAIDMTNDYLKAAKDITDMGFTRILTSGAENKALDGISNIAKIQSMYGNNIEIMAGSGVNTGNIQIIYNKTKVPEFHLSAKKIVKSDMVFKNPKVSMGGFGEVSEYDNVIVDTGTVTKASKIIKQLNEQ